MYALHRVYFIYNNFIEYVRLIKFKLINSTYSGQIQCPLDQFYCAVVFLLETVRSDREKLKAELVN